MIGETPAARLAESVPLTKEPHLFSASDVVAILCLLTALFPDPWGKPLRHLNVIRGIVVPIVCLCILIVGIIAGNSLSALQFAGTIPFASVVTFGSLLALLIIGLLTNESTTLRRGLWNVGLLCLAVGTSQAWVLWALIPLAGVPLLMNRKQKRINLPADGIGNQSRLHNSLTNISPLLCVSLVMYFAGVIFIQANLHSPFWGLFGPVLLLCGMGGLGGWFPIPRVTEQWNGGVSAVHVFATRSLLIAVTGTVLLRLVELQILSLSEIFLMTLPVMISTGLCAVRLSATESLSQRIALISLSTMGFLMMAICLSAWEIAHPNDSLIKDSLMLRGTLFFLAILVCEFSAMLVMICGTQLLNPQPEVADHTEPLAGISQKRPLATISFLSGILSLSGVPPFPGFWWRIGLVTSLLLPFRRSNLSGRIEPDQGFVCLAGFVVLVWCLTSLGQFQLFQRALFDDPFRVKADRSNWQRRLATFIAMSLFLWVAYHSLTT